MMAAHKPGALPLRPLRLGDIFDGAFKIIRFNPGATVGSAVLVTAVAMAIPVLVTGILVSTLDLSTASLQDGNANTADLAGFLGAYGSLMIGSLLQAIGLIFVTGMIAHVTSAAAVGRRLTLGEAWELTRGKRWALVGLTLLLLLATAVYLGVVVGVIVVLALTLPTAAAVVLSILTGLAGVVGMVVGWVRVYYLAVPPLMLEPIGVLEALRRSWRLTSGQFWRTLGIALLTMLITRIAGGILAAPFSIIGVVITSAANISETGVMVFVVTNALGAVVSSAFVAPFTSAVTSVQYLDQRIRKEGYDVELLTRAGITGP